jgi:hypothetical protein
MKPADISGIDRDEWFEMRRRELLGGTGALGATGVSGCLEETTTDTQLESPASEHDHGGDYLGESTPVGQIDVEQLSGNRRDGDTVYYHPDNPGPYTDLEQAAKDVPPGGTLQLGYGTYDVAQEGRIALPHGILVRGAGWRRQPNWGDKDSPVQGTMIVNTGDDAVDKPVIQFRRPDNDNFDRKTTLRDVAVQTSGNAPAVEFHDVIRSLVADCFIRNTGNAPTGIRYSNFAFFARVVRTLVQDFDTYGINVPGRGYAYEFYSNHVRAGKAGLRTAADRTIVMGGEYTAPTGISFNGGSVDGGLVIEPGFEKNEIGVEVGGDDSGLVKNIQLFHTMITGGVETGVRFGESAVNSKYVYPIARGDPTIAEWAPGSRNCLVVTDPEILRLADYRAHSEAVNPHIHVNGSATDGQIAQWKTDVPITVDYGVTAGGPLFYNGQEWRRTASESYQLSR